MNVSVNTSSQQAAILTTDVSHIFISDLHLSPEQPALMQAFLQLLTQLQPLTNLQQLYILGDWFETWVGDDDYLIGDTDIVTWLKPMVTQLLQLRQMGCDILVMHGNRDFLLGQAFCDEFAGQLIQEPYLLKLHDQHYRLEHGDALCTDDKNYQKLRSLVRDPAWQQGMLAKPLAERHKIAELMRLQSKNYQQNLLQQANVSLPNIVDVNFNAVCQAMTSADHLIHGHTHRAGFHTMADGKTRYVLGDWRIKPYHVSSVIGIANCDGFKLVPLCFSV